MTLSSFGFTVEITTPPVSDFWSFKIAALIRQHIGVVFEKRTCGSAHPELDRCVPTPLILSSGHRLSLQYPLFAMMVLVIPVAAFFFL